MFINADMRGANFAGTRYAGLENDNAARDEQCFGVPYEDWLQLSRENN